MAPSSTPAAAPFCDMSQTAAWFAWVDSEQGLGARAWAAENYALHAFGWVLSRQAEWWEHVEAARKGSTPLALVLEHRYARGQRADVVAELLRRAAAAPSTTPAGRPTTAFAVFEMQNRGLGGWHDEAPVAAQQPQQGLRRDAARTIFLGAVRVARRGAHRCLNLECFPGEGGEKLRRTNPSDYCRRHDPRNNRTVPRGERPRVPGRPSEADEAERALFDAVTPLVLPEELSRPSARRLRRNHSRTGGEEDSAHGRGGMTPNEDDPEYQRLMARAPTPEQAQHFRDLLLSLERAREARTVKAQAEAKAERRRVLAQARRAKRS